MENTERMRTTYQTPWKGWFLLALASALTCVTSASVASTNEKAEQRQAMDTAAALTKPYLAEYQLTRRGRRHGEASRQLSQEENNQWRYQTGTEASLLFLSDRRYQDTLFRLNGDRVEPLEFSYRREGTGSNQAFFVRFDYEGERLHSRNGDPVEAEWRDHLLDSNAVLHQLQIDVAGADQLWSYELIDDDGSNREFEFEREGKEVLNLPFGRVEAIRVKRVRETDRRETYFWFAPAHNYTLVQMQQLKEGKEQARVVLSSLTWG